MQVLRPALPKIAAIIGKLPQAPISLALCATLELARRTGQLQADFAFMEGRSLGIVVSDLGMRANIAYRGGRFHPVPDADTPDVRFRASAADFFTLLARKEDPDTLFFQRRLRIEGDTELGLTVKNLLDAIELPGFLQSLLR